MNCPHCKNEMPDGLAIVTTVTLERALNAEKVLQALYSHGVDNWEWYDDAIESMSE